MTSTNVPEPWIVLSALVLEALFGYPARWPHPVVWVGALLARLELWWNKPTAPARRQKFLGVLCLVVTAGLSAGVGYAMQAITMHISIEAVLVAVVATVGLAQRSLYDHVAAVLKPLEKDNLAMGRSMVARIVGRDVTALDASGVAAAALESLAESFNDAVVAPTFWMLVGGLPGLFAYKAVNTADSMVGHKEPRWKNFGWCAARTDDVMNFIPARLAGGFIALAGFAGWRTMFADAAKHASPNAGWPEAAMAGALGIQLGGAAFYDGVRLDRPVLGSGPNASTAKLHAGLKLYVRACGLLWLLVAMAGVLWQR